MSEPDESESNRDDGNRRQGSRDGRKPPPSPAKLARRACGDLEDLIGREVEGVVSLERTDDGWCFGVEVLETARIPDTADVLAEYEVNADRRGRLVGYHRVRRYTRGSTRDDR